MNIHAFFCIFVRLKDILLQHARASIIRFISVKTFDLINEKTSVVMVNGHQIKTIDIMDFFSVHASYRTKFSLTIMNGLFAWHAPLETREPSKVLLTQQGNSNGDHRKKRTPRETLD